MRQLAGVGASVLLIGWSLLASAEQAQVPFNQE
jgi:hypothetical protein